MSHRPARPRAGALAPLILPILVSACSLIGSSSTPAGLPPAGEVAAEQARPAGESRQVTITRAGPPVELPSGLRLRIEEPSVDETDPDMGAALDDAAMLFAAMYQAIDRGDPDDPLYQRYAGREVRASIRAVVSVFASNDWTATGTATIYRRTVDLTSASEASVEWCADLRTVFPMEIASGRVLESAGGDHGYLRYEGTMEQSESGLWVMTALESRRGDPACS